MEEQLLLDEHFNEKKLDNNTDIAEANKIRRDINETTKYIRSGRVAIIVLIVVLAIGTVVEVAQAPELLIYSAIGFAIIAGLYLVAFILSKKKPIAGFALTLGVFILFNILIALDDPMLLFKGWWLKGAILYYLIKGIQQAQQLPKKIEALKGVSLSKEDLELINNYKELSKIHYVKN